MELAEEDCSPFYVRKATTSFSTLPTTSLSLFYFDAELSFLDRKCEKRHQFMCEMTYVPSHNSPQPAVRNRNEVGTKNTKDEGVSTKNTEITVIVDA